MNTYMLKTPRAVYSGKEALEKITDIIGNQYRKIVVFTDKGIEVSGTLELPLTLLKDTGIEIEIFNELPAEPDCDQAQAVVNQFQNSKGDIIVAIGGGSVMDIAKLASVLVSGNHSVRDLVENPSLAEKGVPTLMIPTTAGTGAEATPNSIVLVREKALKVGIVNEAMIADYVILDSRMIAKLPRHIAAATGIDALAHGIECYTSNKANPFSDLFALKAVKEIFNNIEAACDNPDDFEAKEKMLLASFYAGIAITSSGTTAVHALSYPLGGKYHIPHGVANGILLVPVMKFNEPACREKLANVYDELHNDSHSKSVVEKSAWVINRMADMVKHLGIPNDAKALGVPATDLESLVDAGMEVQRLLVNNPREVTRADAKKLYLEIMNLGGIVNESD